MASIRRISVRRSTRLGTAIPSTTGTQVLFNSAIGFSLSIQKVRDARQTTRFPRDRGTVTSFSSLPIPAYSHCAPHAALLVELVANQVSSTDDLADLEDTVRLETLE